MRTRLDRQARNEALVREVNERIDALDRQATQSGTPAFTVFGFHCECGSDGGCNATVEMTLDEYDSVRAQDDRFVLVPGHETPRLERVVERTRRYVVVDKIPQVEPLVADDPRHRGST